VLYRGWLAVTSFRHQPTYDQLYIYFATGLDTTDCVMQHARAGKLYINEVTTILKQLGLQ